MLYNNSINWQGEYYVNYLRSKPQEFDKTVEEMKKHDGFKNTRDGMFNRYYTLSFSKTATAEELNEYVEMLNIHTQLLKNLILLENALTNPDNNPKLLSVVIESTDPKVKKWLLNSSQHY